MLSKHDTNQIQTTVHPGTKFPKFRSACKTVKTSYVPPKYNGETDNGCPYPFQKGEVRKKEVAMGPEQAPNLPRPLQEELQRTMKESSQVFRERKAGGIAIPDLKTGYQAAEIETIQC